MGFAKQNVEHHSRRSSHHRLLEEPHLRLQSAPTCTHLVVNFDCPEPARERANLFLPAKCSPQFGRHVAPACLSGSRGLQERPE